MTAVLTGPQPNDPSSSTSGTTGPDPTGPAPDTYEPGWMIYADLTPPELISARRLRALRRSMLLGLGALVVVIVLLFLATLVRGRQAADDLAREQAVSSQLVTQQARYGVVTQIEGSTAGVRAQLATLMADEVDVTGVLTSITATLPRGVALTAVQTTVNAGGTAAGGSAGTTSLDTSGAVQIGQVTLAGTAPGLESVSAYVDALSRRPGLVDVVPVTNQGTGTAFTFSITAAVTDAVLTDRYSVTPTVTPTATAAATPAATPAPSSAATTGAAR